MGVRLHPLFKIVAQFAISGLSFPLSADAAVYRLSRIDAYFYVVSHSQALLTCSRMELHEKTAKNCYCKPTTRLRLATSFGEKVRISFGGDKYF